MRSMSVQPLYDAARVGGDVLSWCTKCKMDLAHVVVAMVGIRPAKVICKTCKSQHNYKAPNTGGVSLPRASTPRKAAAPRTYVRASEYFDQKMAEKQSAPLLGYNPKEIFRKGDVIRHVNFGVGIVEEVKRGGKIVILFREGEKTLIHGHGNPAVT